MLERINELQDFDKIARAEKNRSTIWVARWLLERPDDEPFYAMQFRHTLGGIMVREAKLTMPDVEVALKKFGAAGMVEPTKTPDDDTRVNLLVPVRTERWDPYLEIFMDHIEKHPAEFAAIDAAIQMDK